MYLSATSTFVINLGLLLITVNKTMAIQCVVCEGSGQFSKCESDKKVNTTHCSPKYPYCSIETRTAFGRINLVRRRCSNRTLTLTHHPLMKFLNPKTNVSMCVYQKALICAWLCDKDFCNGISNHSPIFSGDHTLLQFVVLLSVLFVFGFTETPHLTRD